MNHNAAQHYWEQQILNATPAERIVLLYRGAIKFLVQAKQCIEKKDIEGRFNNNRRAGDIILYLKETLDMEKGAEIASNLSRLYSHMLARLVAVDMENDITAIDEVVGQLRTLHASWDKIAKGEVDMKGGNNADGDSSDESDSSSGVERKITRDAIV